LSIVVALSGTRWLGAGIFLGAGVGYFPFHHSKKR